MCLHLDIFNFFFSRPLEGGTGVTSNHDNEAAPRVHFQVQPTHYRRRHPSKSQEAKSKSLLTNKIEFWLIDPDIRMSKSY